MSDRDEAIDALLAKQEITELLTRYLRSVDRGDLVTLRSCYLPGATEDHGGVFSGPAADYVDVIARDLTHPRSRSSHNLTNLLIEVHGNTATAESYCIAFSRIKAGGSYHHCFVGARMLDRLQKRGGRWGIAHRQVLWDWSHDAPDTETWMQGLLAPDLSVLTMSGKFPHDPVYDLERELGEEQPAAEEDTEEEEEEEEEEKEEKVEPIGIFDPFEEANRRW